MVSQKSLRVWNINMDQVSGQKISSNPPLPPHIPPPFPLPTAISAPHKHETFISNPNICQPNEGKYSTYIT